MSKFFITNNSELFKKVKRTINESEYQTSFFYEVDNTYAISTRKLAFDNQNGVELDKGFTIVTGTMAWQDGEYKNAD